MFSIARKDEWDSTASTVLAGALILTIVLLILAQPASWFAGAAGLIVSLARIAQPPALAPRLA